MVRVPPVAALILAGSAALWGGPGGELKSGALNPSARCGECHREIYSMWQRSLHGLSVTDPVFATSYMRAYVETGGEARKICLRCHAPVATLTGDLDLREPTSREGITCDYCHSIVSVDLARRDQPFTLALAGVKRGPLAGAESPAHGTATSALHQSSEFCAGCHEYANGEGVAIFSTYTEWKASPQAKEGKTCQHCHMPMTAGRTVRPSLGVGRQGINLHDISGGHSSEQVRKAAITRIVGVVRKQPTVAAVAVEVANVGSGHCIPTGLPTRKLVLEVVLFCGEQEVRRFERQYRKALLDASGRPISDDHKVILEAKAVQEDNRIRPGERRVERFTAEVPPEGTLRAEARLRYLYEPELLLRQAMSIEMGSDTYP